MLTVTTGSSCMTYELPSMPCETIWRSRCCLKTLCPWIMWIHRWSQKIGLSQGSVWDMKRISITRHSFRMLQTRFSLDCTIDCRQRAQITNACMLQAQQVCALAKLLLALRMNYIITLHSCTVYIAAALAPPTTVYTDATAVCQLQQASLLQTAVLAWALCT